jgi:hypothetical protein
MSDSMLYAAVAYRQRKRSNAGQAFDEAELQAWLDRQRTEQGDERVLVRDLDTYPGPDPDIVHCGRIEIVGGGRFVLDRTTRTWTKRPWSMTRAEARLRIVLIAYNRSHAVVIGARCALCRLRVRR